MTVSADEFIRRFLLHTLPPGFQRIRHYGLLASRNKKERLLACPSHCTFERRGPRLEPRYLSVRMRH
jgi:hypothetical protein